MTRVLKTFKREDVPLELLGEISYFHLGRSTAFDWAVIGICWWLMMNTSPYLYPLWGIIVAGKIHAFGVILHDLCHQNLSRKTFSFRALEILTGYFIGSSANSMAYHHIRHHRRTLMNNDPYYNINKKCIGIVRCWLALKKGLFFEFFWISRSFAAPFALLIPSFRTSYARFFLQDVSNEDLTHDKEVLTCIREDIPIMLFHIVLLSLALTRFEFLLYGYYYILPFAGVFCIYRLLIEHEYNIVKDRSIYTMIETTFDHHTSIWEKWAIGPHNIGYHCMHHIHPLVGYQALPSLQKWYVENSEHYRDKYSNRTKWSWKEDLFGGIYHDHQLR